VARRLRAHVKSRQEVAENSALARNHQAGKI
jgi:hypothetical protein